MGSLIFKSSKEKLSDVPKNLWDIIVKDIDGKELTLAQFKNNKALIFVNVASACNFTPKQYKGLNSLYEKYHMQGLEILAFPCNQFMNQESKCDADIKAFTQAMKVKFPMFSKIDVNGPNTHPLYRYLRANSILYDANKGTYQEIPWNFAKFLVDNNGKVIEMFGPDVPPENMSNAIDPLLKQGNITPWVMMRIRS